MASADALLVQRAKQGDHTAFEEIYEASYERLFKYVYYRVGDQAVAEDITSDTFVKLVDKIDSYEDRGRPLIAWLYTIAGNLVRDLHRRNGRIQFESLESDDRPELPEDKNASDPVSLTDLSLDSKRLVSAILELTEEQQQVIILKFVEGRSNADVAAVIGKNEGSVKSLQHRALRSLKRILGAEQKIS